MLLAEAVRRAVEVARPIRIILFGSAARGTMGPDSDFDLLVVVPGPVHQRRMAQRIHAAFVGLGAPVDVIVVTPEDIERFRNRVGPVVMPALAEGREVYAA
jgi:predicted nucleotidyltransferase